MIYKNNFSGFGVALVTPFDQNKNIDIVALEMLVEYVVNNGVDYVVALGTTSEMPTLSSEEADVVLQTIIDKVNGRIPIVLGVGGNNTQEVIHKISLLPQQDIAGILSVVPYYNKPNQAGMYQHFKAIAEHTALPVILYNIPSRTGVNMEYKTTVKLAREVENIVAVKEASGDFVQMMKIIRHRPEGFAVLSGDDMYALPLLKMGGDGIISVIGNAFPRKFGTMIHAAMAGDADKATQIHYDLMDLFQHIFKEGNPAGIKAVLNMIGITQQYLRLPLVQISNDLNIKITEEIKRLNLMNVFKKS